MSDNSEIGTLLFALGQVVATPAALNAIAELGLSPLALIHRHVTGDWGDLNVEDDQAKYVGVTQQCSYIFELQGQLQNHDMDHH